jgi:hypothetical protein
MEYYSVLKRNKLSSHENMEKSETLLLSERSQPEKAINCTHITNTWLPRKGKIMPTVKTSWLPIVKAEGGMN